MTTEKLVDWIRELIEKDEMWRFYKSKEFRGLQKEVLKEQHNECQVCKQRGLITKADTVHHVQYVRNHPELALSKTYVLDGIRKRNLIAVCRDCHNKIHKEKGYIRNTIKVVTGFPGCGKTTYVKNHRVAEEPVYDLDYIAEALSLDGEMDRDQMAAVANGLLESFAKDCRARNLSAWIIRTAPSIKDMELFEMVGAVYIDLPFDEEKCRKRRIISDQDAEKIRNRYMVYRHSKERTAKTERW